MKGCDFSYRHYMETIRAFVDAGYWVTNFGSVMDRGERERVLVLRHDEDMSLDSASRMAVVDHELGVQSTFFLRVHARGYNLLSWDGHQIRDQLSKAGHELGLHFEPGIARLWGLEVRELLEAELLLFTKFAGSDRVGISFHEPSRMGMPEGLDSRGDMPMLRYNAYESRFASSMKYISDSGGRWREGCFHEWVGKEPRLQVLLHPFWWFDRQPQENY